jgi:2-iminobutanoate/2-iminopropanoate deaminase
LHGPATAPSSTKGHAGADQAGWRKPATLADLVKTTTFVTDIDEFFKHVDVRHDYLGVGLPASTTVEVRRRSHPDLMVEIEAIALLDR